MTILITGCSSYVATNLIQKLKKKNINYIGIDINTKKNDNNFYNVDISKEKSFKKIKHKKITSIIHLAAISSDRSAKKNPLKCFDVNFRGTLNLINFANKKKIKKFIFASTEWVYDNSKYKINSVNKDLDFFNLKNIYAASKLLCEEVLLSQKLFKVCILRFGIIYGKRVKDFSAVESIASSLKNNSKIFIGSKQTMRSFIYIDDVVDALILSLRVKNTCTADIQGPDKVSLGKIIQIILKLLKKKVKIVETDRNNPSVRNVIRSKKIDLLSWKPKVGIKEGLYKFLNENR